MKKPIILIWRGGSALREDSINLCVEGDDDIFFVARGTSGMRWPAICRAALVWSDALHVPVYVRHDDDATERRITKANLRRIARGWPPVRKGTT